MSKEKIESLEKLCLENIKKQNNGEFMLNYNLFNAFGGSSSYLKAYMLVLLLSNNNLKDYYILMQTITPEELDNGYIQVVLELERLTNTGNLRKLESLIKNQKASEFVSLLKQVLENQKNSYADIQSGTVDKKQQTNNEERIKDMLYVSNTSSMF